MITMKSYNWILSTLLATMLLVGISCGGSTPSQYYTLSSVRNGTGAQQNEVAQPSIAIGIRTLKLPEYLLRQQIITKTGNRIIIAEFNRWAEPLEANFKRVLIEDLSADIPTNNIFLFPARDSSVVNYQLLLEVTEFEFIDGQVLLSARWGLEKGEKIAFLMDERSSFSERSGDSYEEMVATMSRLIGRLSKEIAVEIRSKVTLGS